MESKKKWKENGRLGKGGVGEKIGEEMFLSNENEKSKKMFEEGRILRKIIFERKEWRRKLIVKIRRGNEWGKRGDSNGEREKVKGIKMRSEIKKGGKRMMKEENIKRIVLKYGRMKKMRKGEENKRVIGRVILEKVDEEEMKVMSKKIRKLGVGKKRKIMRIGRK